ncbi:MAG: transglutaminase-like domain-containing protein [Spirochaetota bacterium]
MRMTHGIKAACLFTTVTSLLIYAAIVTGSDMPSTFDPALSTVKVNQLAPGAYTEKLSLYLLTSGNTSFSLPETAFQKVIQQKTLGEKTGIIVSTGRNREHSEKPSGIHTGDTRLLDIDHPSVKELSAEIKGTDTGKIISVIESRVHKIINKKSYGIPIVSAPKIIDSKSGDCTEHTVLSVALLRSLDIPARAIVGMVLTKNFAGKRNVFVYHMWAEAFIDGSWILVDATRPGEKHPNRYIALAFHSLETKSPLSYLEALSAIKELSVTYVKP